MLGHLVHLFLCHFDGNHDDDGGGDDDGSGGDGDDDTDDDQGDLKEFKLLTCLATSSTCSSLMPKEPLATVRNSSVSTTLR